ncbi:hypothetical protein [Gymnodinialimonas hymeniacidonis]|uniref:hypothetical protein n=1 Tax=Gymnodinialimonas hymeniacidonis TaxID=3126508 RepID=UPI0034C6C867
MPVGEGGAFGPVLGTAPREAVGPGPFLTGGGGAAGPSPTAAPAAAAATFPAE